ncbi:MAG: nodulation protein NodH [Boseongicola sp.]|nr:nodulation protein NodH [Boseongicola sp.]MDD9978925.1 nodulation protein NodH [Boseongicola sp.]
MTDAPFEYFVILAGMRTGSNLLEENLAAFPGVESHGELFNPHFFGKPKVTNLFGLSMEARDADPVRVVGAMKTQGEGLPGFRLFYDHSPAAIRHVLSDPKAGKIVLSRRPIDSYVSLKIARKTGQWWLGDMTTARAAKVPFDPIEYGEFLNTLNDFQSQIARSLQITGQTAFHIQYDDLHDTDIIRGLGKFLGITSDPDPEKIRAKVQNPSPLSDRLTNPDVADRALASMSIADIGQVPVHEPGRGPGIKFFRAGHKTPLLYMPIRGAGFDPIPDWLASLDGSETTISGMTQRDLRKWMREHSGHRAFTVLRHPLPRAYDAFCRFILPTDAENYADVRHGMKERYDVHLPDEWPSADWSLEDHRRGFLGFLEFLKGNLGGQTSLRVDNTWASQDTLLHAIAGFVVPDVVVREGSIVSDLQDLLGDVGIFTDVPDLSFNVMAPYHLRDVVDADIEKAVETAYRRDFMMFGFERWSRILDQAA